MTSCVTFSWSRSSCKMTCLSWHSSKKSSECRLSCKAGKKVSWVQSTTSSLSLSPSFGVSSSATAGRGQVVWAWATLHHEGSVQPRPRGPGRSCKVSEQPWMVWTPGCPSLFLKVDIPLWPHCEVIMPAGWFTPEIVSKPGCSRVSSDHRATSQNSPSWISKAIP